MTRSELANVYAMFMSNGEMPSIVREPAQRYHQFFRNQLDAILIFENQRDSIIFFGTQRNDRMEFPTHPQVGGINLVLIIELGT